MVIGAGVHLASGPAGVGDGRSEGGGDLRTPHFSLKTLEFCFTHSNSRFGETFWSFVNGQYTSDGYHPSAFREGLLKAINEIAGGKFEGDDVRAESMVGAVAIRLKDPVSQSQTKNKLGNTEIRTDLVNRVREEILHYLHRDKATTEKIVAKCQTHPAAPEGAAGGQEAGPRTVQGRVPPDPAAQGLPGALRQGQGQGARLHDLPLRGRQRRRLITSCRTSTPRPSSPSAASPSTSGTSSAT